MKRLALILAVVAVALTVSASAYGATATGDAYGGNGGGILGAVEQGNGGNSGGGGNAGGTADTPAPQQVQTASSESSLPFTGLDLGLLALGGIALVGVGVGLRRYARPLS